MNTGPKVCESGYEPTVSRLWWGNTEVWKGVTLVKVVVYLYQYKWRIPLFLLKSKEWWLPG